MTKAILIPGNGGGSPRDNWFPYLKSELEKLNVTVIDEQFPDSNLARAIFWLPFLKELNADKDTILIGHSSGAVAAMRYSETTPILGSVLVGACYTDLGLETEKISGYYDAPWNWDAIKKNQKWIVQFASSDDPWIPIHEARVIHENLNTDYFEYSDRGHFGGDYYKPDFPEALAAINKHLSGSASQS